MILIVIFVEIQVLYFDSTNIQRVIRMFRSTSLTLMFTTLLLGCTEGFEGDINVLGGDPDTTINVGGSSSFESEADLYAQGEAVYLDQCANCHGAKGAGDPGSTILGAIRNETAISLTHNTMPLGNAEFCDYDCSIAVVAWVAMENNIKLNIDISNASGTSDNSEKSEEDKKGDAAAKMGLDIFVSEDSYIHRKNGDENFGQSEMLGTKYSDVQKNGSRKALFKFLLPEIATQHYKAELFYYHSSESPADVGSSISIDLLENNWSENLVTWNNAPASRFEVAAFTAQTLNTSVGSWEIIDVTSAVKMMVLEGEDAISFSVNNGNSHMISISSREYHNAVTGAVLSIKSINLPGGNNNNANTSSDQDNSGTNTDNSDTGDSSEDASSDTNNGNIDSGNNPTTPDSDPNANTDPNTDQVESGRKQYAAQCAGCHGTVGDGQPRGSSIIGTLFDNDYARTVETTMPFGSAGSCGVTCSVDITVWMRTQHEDPNNNNNGNTDNSSNESTDNSPVQDTGNLDTSNPLTASDSILLSRLYKASMNLNSIVPKQSWVNMVKNDGENGLASALDQMMNEETFYQRLQEIYAPALQHVGRVSRQYVRSFSGNDEWWKSLDSNNEEKFAENAAKVGLGNSAIELVNYVVKNNKPFTEILTADYLVLNYYGARSLGLLSQVEFTRISNPEYSDLPYSPAEFKKVRSPDVPMAGVLTTQPFMDNYPTTITNVNRHRSYNVFKMFLDTDILEISGSRVEADDIVIEHPTMNSPTCTGCHTVMDPVASTFRHWQRGTERRETYKDAKWAQEGILEPGFNGQTMPFDNSAPLQWLVPKIASDRRFAVATVKTLFQEITGHPVLAKPSSNSNTIDIQRYDYQQTVINELADSFVNTNYDLKALIKALLTSDYFNGETYIGGSSRLIPANRFKRKLLATTGDNSFSGSNALLAGDVYVGDQPNGIMVLINQYTASYISCEALGKDLSKAYGDRLLLPNFVTEDELHNSNGSKSGRAHNAVKADVQNLMWVLWGKNVNTNDAVLIDLYESYLAFVLRGSVDQDTSTLSGNCRYTDPASGLTVSKDPDFRVRGWVAVLNLMIDDYRYLYE